jgi:hypothetical protein
MNEQLQERIPLDELLPSNPFRRKRIWDTRREVYAA